ncbi:MAG: cell division protein FtsX [Pseudorhodoplanes sp.]|uniref:cell division protein FtsX n=1 Tax=Pseudorhodoplanes sp. TaxID=1934341 RepID=UPI003D139BE4
MESPLVPHQSIGGRALVAVVAIMTFLASLTTGAVMLVRMNAADWQAEILREVTIQIRPVEGGNLDNAVKEAADLARGFTGVSDVRPYSREESAKLLEPWFGSGLKLDELPVPRVIVVKLASGADVDVAALRKALSDKVPAASVDDHRGWIGRMRAIADFVMLVGIAVLGLVIAVTILCVNFATRGAMAANRPVIEVLHFVGAQDRFIAGQFQRHFLWLGLKGGVLGGLAAILLFALIAPVEAMIRGNAGAEQFAALFGSITMGLTGYLVILAQIVVIAAVASEASRRTVNQTIASI